MRLVIDQGNTRTKVAIFDRFGLKERKDFLKTDAAAINKYLKGLTGIDASIVSSVVDETIDLSQFNPLFLNAETKIPLINDYTTPKSLGVDRLANAVGAHFLAPKKNILVIDAGTCIKYDLVDEIGKYLGGNISPGVQMRYQSLNDYTAKLPLLEKTDFEYGYGTTTKTSILNGVQQGIYHEIRGFVDRYAKDFLSLTIFMTGGDANYFDIEHKNPIFANPNITLIGLNEILEYNI